MYISIAHSTRRIAIKVPLYVGYMYKSRRFYTNTHKSIAIMRYFSKYGTTNDENLADVNAEHMRRYLQQFFVM